MDYDVPLYQMGLDTERGYKDVVLVPSVYRFEPVTLRPGEGTVITVDHPLRPRWREAGKPVDGKEGLYISVGYTVVPSLAERFNLWQGTLVSEPVRLQPVVRRPPAPEGIRDTRRIAPEEQPAEEKRTVVSK